MIREKLKIPSSTGALALLLIGLILSVQYAGAWYGLEILRISKETELENHLKDLGRMVSPDFVHDALSLADVAYEIVEANSAQANSDLAGAESPLADEFRIRTSLLPKVRFHEYLEAARLHSLTLLDDSGRILYSTYDPERAWGTFDYLSMDGPQFEQALEGKAAGSLAYHSNNSPHKRVYVPLRDPETGGVAAVLCLAAGRDFLGQIEAVGEAMMVVSLVSTLLILLIGWLVYRLLNRQRQYERQAAHTDRLSSLGTLAAGFAHEVRNPLEIISACTEDLERSLRDADSPPHAQEACRDILEEVDRLNRLVGQFLQFSKSDATDVEGGGTSVADALASALAMLRHNAEKRQIRLSLTSELVPGGGWIAMTESAFKQIIINLVMNAIHASPEGGTVNLEVLEEDRRIQIKVVDTGPGVPVQIRPRIFEPFFTTRPEGSGLGLAIAHQLACSAGGSLEYQDNPGGGACFVLSLPQRAGEVRKIRAQDPAVAAGVR